MKEESNDRFPSRTILSHHSQDVTYWLVPLNLWPTRYSLWQSGWMILQLLLTLIPAMLIWVLPSHHLHKWSTNRMTNCWQLHAFSCTHEPNINPMASSFLSRQCQRCTTLLKRENPLPSLPHPPINTASVIVPLLICWHQTLVKRYTPNNPQPTLDATWPPYSKQSVDRPMILIVASNAKRQDPTNWVVVWQSGQQNPGRISITGCQDRMEAHTEAPCKPPEQLNDQPSGGPRGSTAQAPSLHNLWREPVAIPLHVESVKGAGSTRGYWRRDHALG